MTALLCDLAWMHTLAQVAEENSKAIFSGKIFCACRKKVVILQTNETDYDT